MQALFLLATLLIQPPPIQEGDVPQDGAAPDGAHGDAPPQEKVQATIAKEARDAMARFTIPDGFGVSLFAAEPMMAHPVAFTIDAFGRMFVAETFRHSKGVTDMRQHMDWLEDDLAIRTVEDRVAMFRKHETPEVFEEEYATESERVTRLVDTDGDGVADQSTIFAQGFDEPAAGIAAGLLARPLPDGGTELWFTCIPQLWRLLDEDGDGIAESRAVHSDGYGLRVALLGHDLHGLVIGLDGRLYFSIGDRGFNVETAEGKKLVRYGTGGVFRCELDGSNFELFCDGLRNPQELVFDDFGNLFTLDNNSDGGDQARWTWLLEGSDTGWRQAYQWVESPHRRGPWNQEGMWKPHFKEQPAFILPPIANFTSGPSGLALYPGTGFGEDYDGAFFICDFRGNPGYSGIYAMENEPDRSGFKLVNTRKFVWDALPTDVEFGPDGNLYWSDWVTGWNKTGKGRIYRVSPDERSEAETAMVKEVGELLRTPMGTLSTERLLELFSHRDRRVRQEAQLALAQRMIEAPSPEEFASMVRRMLVVLPVKAERARVHMLGCMAQVARRRPSSLVDFLEVRNSANVGPWSGPKLRAFNLRILADTLAALPEETRRLEGHAAMSAARFDVYGSGEDEDPRVRLARAEAVGKLPLRVGEFTQQEILVGYLKSNDGQDPWMRAATTRALELLGAAEIVLKAQGDMTPGARLSSVVVLRRLRDARVAQFLSDEDPLVRAEAARAIYDARIEGAMGALAAHLPLLPPTQDVLTIRRALHANREVAGAEAASRLADFVTTDTAADELRAEAVEILARWHEPRTRDGILLDYRPIPGGAESDIRALLSHQAAQLILAETCLRAKEVTGPELSDAEINLMEGKLGGHNPRAPKLAVALIEWHRRLGALAQPQASASALRLMASAEELTDKNRVRAFEALLETFPNDQRTLGFSLAARTLPGLLPLRPAAYAVLDDAEAAKLLGAEARSQDPVARREGVRVLGGLRGEACMEIFAEVGMSLDPSAPELVEWLEAAKGHPGESTKAARLMHKARWEAEDADGTLAWLMCLEGGDRDLGEKLFMSKSETSCLKCHVVGSEGGSEAGPALDGVGERLKGIDILRSVVEPNAAIAEGYETWLLSLDDGEILSGRILEETAENVVLENAKKEVFDIAPDEIVGRRRDVSAMPGDISTHLSRREMRDLIAFLSKL